MFRLSVCRQSGGNYSRSAVVVPAERWTDILMDGLTSFSNETHLFVLMSSLKLCGWSSVRVEFLNFGVKIKRNKDYSLRRKNSSKPPTALHLERGQVISIIYFYRFWSRLKQTGSEGPSNYIALFQVSSANVIINPLNITGYYIYHLF